MKNINPITAFNLRTIFFLLFLFSFLYPIEGQKGIRLNTEEAYKGYKLCSSNFANRTYLLDNCGKIVHQWVNTNPQYYCRLTEEGTLIYISGNSIIERGWDGSFLNVIQVNSSNIRLDYEVMKLDNGNFLAVARRLRNLTYFSNLGWDPNLPKPGQTDGIIEVNQNGDIVWEWNIGDHTIQDKNSNVSNFGNLAIFPGRVDINAISTFDWTNEESFMINSMDYNKELDQILISVRKVSEIMVIDHSTTTEEAAGSIGGKYGKGGDILYRWGNPQNYSYGNESDRVLYYQHNPNWVKYGEHKGKIIVYNNGLDRFIPGVGNISSVHIIDPPIDADGNYERTLGFAFEPETADITIDEVTTGNSFYSGYTSGAQVLPNGNIYITVGLPSDFLEVKTDGTLVWEYSLDNSSYIFRSEQYPRDYPAFEGKDLTPGSTVESPSSSYNCELFTSTKESTNLQPFDIQYDNINKSIRIIRAEASENMLCITNTQGQLVQSIKDVKSNDEISINHLPFGLYFVSLLDSETNAQKTFKIVR
ncbi:MAG: aryl-sulfate sulfotransferase [Saprospiraceae bacterium]|nr:aryl-sulfate sulfotransferase [Saprospiraceae bacterium]